MGNLEFAEDERVKCKKGVRFPYADADGVHWEETVFRGITLGMLWLVFVLMITTYSSPAAFAQEIKTCGDFAYQDDAQKFYDSGGGRPQDWYGGMDQNNDGVACEHLPAKPMHLKTGFRFAVGSGVGLLAIGGVILWKSRGERLQTGVSAAPAPPSPTRRVAVEPSAIEVQSPPQLVVHVQQSVDSSSRAESASRAEASATSQVSDSLCPWEEAHSPYVPLSFEKYPLSGFIPLEVLKRMPYNAYLKTYHWKTVSTEAKARAGHRCQRPDCNAKGPLDVHHKVYDRGNEKPEHLEVLCRDHHLQVHRELKNARSVENAG